jgi:hypothetical protein
LRVMQKNYLDRSIGNGEPPLAGDPHF